MSGYFEFLEALGNPAHPEHETMQEGQPRRALTKGHNGRMFVEALLVRPPSLERAAGHLKRLGRLTQGEPLGLQSEILIEEVRASDAIPSWGLDHGVGHPLLLLCDAKAPNC